MTRLAPPAPSPNPALPALGFSPTDRVVIFHADDLGMTEATVSAYRDLMEVGLLSSASVMLPCAWSPAAVQAARDVPGSDVGVHLTLTSEWDACRWRPLLTPEDPRLVDGAGFFHRRVEDARQADPGTVGRELRAQVGAALAWGLDVTHLDAHMGAAADPRYVREVAELAATRGIPLLYPRFPAAGWQAVGLDAGQAAQAEGLGQVLEQRGFPLVDHLRMLPLDQGGDHAALTLAWLRDLPAGITHFILHPARDTPELRAVASDWAGRVANYEAFRRPELRRAVEDLGVQVIGYGPLRDLLRRKLGGAA